MDESKGKEDVAVKVSSSMECDSDRADPASGGSAFARFENVSF